MHQSPTSGVKITLKWLNYGAITLQILTIPFPPCILLLLSSINHYFTYF